MESPETNTKSFKRINNTTLAYVAGLLDGEGHFVAYQTQKGCWSVRVAITNSCPGLLDWLSSMFGGNRQLKTKGPLTKRDCWEWRPGDAARFLKLMKPYIRLKRPHLEVALAFFSVPWGATEKKGRLAAKLKRLNEDRVQYSWQHET